MEKVVDLIIAGAELAETEGRTLFRGLVRLAVVLSIATLACLIVTCGFALLIVALYLGLAPAVGSAWAAAICGILLLLIAGAGALVAMRLTPAKHGASSALAKRELERESERRAAEQEMQASEAPMPAMAGQV